MLALLTRVEERLVKKLREEGGGRTYRMHMPLVGPPFMTVTDFTGKRWFKVEVNCVGEFLLRGTYTPEGRTSGPILEFGITTVTGIVNKILAQ